MKNIFIFLIISLSSLSAIAQEITYSKPEGDDLLYAAGPDKSDIDQPSVYKYAIIGTSGNNLLVYKKIRYKQLICIYDDQMKLKENVKLSFLPSNVISVCFVKSGDRIYVIYQFQKRKIFYCMAAVVDENGKRVKEPFQLDTTHVTFFADLKLYHVTSSEDKSKIIVYKVHHEDDLYDFTTLLFNDSLQLIHKSQTSSNFEAVHGLLSNFLVDNEGNLVFTKGSRLGTTDLLFELILVTKAPTQDNFQMHAMNLGGNLLDRIDLQIDNVNQQYLINSLFCKKGNGRKDGLFTARWSKKDNSMAEDIFAFTGISSTIDKMQNADVNVFAYYYLRNVILMKDGGFIITAEDLSATGGYLLPWYLVDHPIFSSASYLFSSFKLLGSLYQKDIMILCFDNKENFLWSNFIVKLQNGGMPSYAVINTGDKIHFLYNEFERQTDIVNEQTLTINGKLSEKLTLKNLNLLYDLYPSGGEQVNSHEMIFPCLRGHYTCFAKIKY